MKELIYTISSQSLDKVNVFSCTICSIKISIPVLNQPVEFSKVDMLKEFLTSFKIPEFDYAIDTVA